MQRSRRKNAGVQKSYKEVSPATAPSVGSNGRAFARPPPRPDAKKKDKGKGSQVITLRSPPKVGKAGKAGKKKTPASGTKGAGTRNRLNRNGEWALVELVEKINPLGADQWDLVAHELQKWAVIRSEESGWTSPAVIASANGTSSAISKIGQSNPAGQGPYLSRNTRLSSAKNLPKQVRCR
jgi:hypothetical protein